MSAELSIRRQRSPERYSHAFGGSVERLPEGWVCGRHCNIGGDPVRPMRMDLVLMHPGLGIALLDIGERTEKAEEVLRARLEEARFGAIFGGYLPVVHGCLGPDEVPDMAEIARAFDRVPPLSVSGGSAWISTASRLIVPVDQAWADNWEGAPSRGAAGRTGSTPEPVRAAKVVPLRRVASVQAPAAEAEDLVLPIEAPPRRRKAPWLLAGSAGIAVVAVLAGLLLNSGSRPEGAAKTAVVTAPVQPAQSPVLAVTPVSAPHLAPTPVQPVSPPIVTGRPVVATPVSPPAAAHRPPSRPVRMVRERANSPARKPVQRPAAHRPGRT